MKARRDGEAPQNLVLNATPSNLAFIRLSTTLMMAVVPLGIYYLGGGEKIANPLYRNLILIAVIVFAVLLSIFTIGSLFSSLSVKDGRFIHRQWWRTRSVKLSDCHNLQWAYGTPVSSPKAGVNFYLIFLMTEKAGDRRMIWNLGWVWKLMNMGRFIESVRLSIGLPAYGAEGHIGQDWSKIAGEE